MLRIKYPTPGTGVCNKFLAWGWSDAGLPVSGEMLLDPFQIQGVTLQNPAEGQPWIIQFTDVPNGVGYTLVVEDSPTNGAQSGNLTVDPKFCLVGQPLPPGYTPPGASGP